MTDDVRVKLAADEVAIEKYQEDPAARGFYLVVARLSPEGAERLASALIEAAHNARAARGDRLARALKKIKERIAEQEADLAALRDQLAAHEGLEARP